MIISKCHLPIVKALFLRKKTMLIAFTTYTLLSDSRIGITIDINIVIPQPAV